MDKYYLSKNYKTVSNAGNKAKTDIETILFRHGFKNAGFKQTSIKNSFIGFIITFAGIIKAFFTLRKNSVLVVQYPLKKYFTLVCKIAHFRKCQVITIIHDLGSFRRQKLTVEQEMKRLSHSDYIVAHNNIMKGWLEENGCKKPVGNLEIFDYLSDVSAPAERKVTKPYKVLFAGGLSYKKSAFLYSIGDSIRSYKLNLYGSGFEPSEAKGAENISYKGFVPSDSLIQDADGDFGLVWDGDSVTTCSGVYGEYLKYNNPHKTSLYIRCHLPVIIWDKAALASFVRENHIGICIDSLEHLDTVISEISCDEYEMMMHSIDLVSRKLSEGYYTMKAINEAIKHLSKKIN
ncbi:MAG: galactofuranosyltransferase [Dysgonomonas sp.]